MKTKSTRVQQKTPGSHESTRIPQRKETVIQHKGRNTDQITSNRCEHRTGETETPQAQELRQGDNYRKLTK